MKSLQSDKRSIFTAAAIFIAVLIYMYFFLEGLRLFDSDYYQWIKPAISEPFFKSAGDFLNPVLFDWNINFRPFQVFIYKGLFSLFGYEANGYFFFKAFITGLLSLAYFFFILRYLKNFAVAAASALFIGISSSTYTSLFWVSDFVVVSELITLCVYAVFLELDLSDKPRKAMKTAVTLVIIVILTIIADRTKANAKLIPGIIFLYLILTGPKRLYRYWPALVAMGLSLVPVAKILKSPVPTFIYAEPGTVTPASWQPASIEKFWRLFGAGFEPLSFTYKTHPPISILSIIGFVLLYAFLIAAVFLIYKKVKTRKSAGSASLRDTLKENKAIVFFFSWAAINLLAMLSYPELPDYFQARYAISFFIPAIPLVFLTVYSAASLIGDRTGGTGGGGGGRTGGAILALLLIVHLCFHSYQTFRVRNNFPTLMIASDTLREYVSSTYKGRHFYYLRLPNYYYRVDDKSDNKFISSFKEPNIIVAAKKFGIRPNDFLLISFEQIDDPTLLLIREFPGISGAHFDRLFNSGVSKRNRTTFYLYEVNI